MNPIATLPSVNPTVNSANAGVTYQSSRLFPSLFQKNDPKKRLSVLETGQVTRETIGFLGQFKSRIHVANLFSENLIREQQAELSEKEMKHEFQNLLEFKVGTLIDVCLFWDFLNYLNPAALRAFGSALRPYVHKGTRAHGFTVLNIETPLRNQQYGIGSPDTLCVRPGKQSQLDYYPHSHEELNRSFDCFEIGRGWLLPDGRLEILLKACV
ncbi:MAG: hypothetical protein ACI9H8_000534 [Lysobacterales bacterium]|jgi:hypothetical protein